MIPYTLAILDVARETAAALPEKDRRMIMDALRIIQAVPHREGTRLTDDLAGFRRLKKGRYRIFYEIKEAEHLIRVLFIGHRKEGDKQDAYRLFRKLIGR